VPVPAAGQTEVVTRDLHPLVVPRGLEHPLQQLVIVPLELVTLAQGAAGVLHARRQGVADRLELAEVEHSRLARERRHLIGHLQATECLADQSRLLSFKPTDLASKLGTGKALVPIHLRRKPTISL
jgi:hypothetical protein